MLQSSRLSLQTVLETANSEISRGDAREFGEGVLAVVAVLAENVALRKILADSSESAEKKQQLLRTLFSTRTTDAVLRLAEKAVGLRWARTQDLVTSIEVAGVTAIAAHAQAEGRLGQVEEEVFRFARLLESDHDLARALDSDAGAETKRELIANLLDGKAHRATITLIEQAAVHPRGLRVAIALDQYSDVLAARQQRSVAEVTVAAPLSESQTERLQAALAKAYGRELVLNVQIDPTVIGGARVQVGDEVMNATVADRLAEVHRRLTR
ncbi:ATP synthase F1 subcomplex delta subunit [Brevibacterium sanguinis]|uniref:ATP synthase subunit delta n=2 Tax=Brevibacterium TaxID=1696 RepID=A0A366IMT8_9MICO|nr:MULTISPECIES: F0F1 ATP synthase subunit delta [Brevibacterium]RBP66349.1 ATP synthase F1 subcomplex delta subunit [Brevibacterium sanguinis]RBP73000.1 ATP synthase F1 subcomplex delta subunit [Brevibacterium celere]